ncbi:hypothetical protein J699_01826 [Acinetobacter sp. 1000160]|nr:hypothetical protein J522_0577 [Acinetobacter baumannii 146457]EYT21769.1 hypothetical protein J699_01826 [Acinetobacter sp. 1000160]
MNRHNNNKDRVTLSIIIKSDGFGSFSAKKLTFISENHLKLCRF